MHADRRLRAFLRLARGRRLAGEDSPCSQLNRRKGSSCRVDGLAVAGLMAQQPRLAATPRDAVAWDRGHRLFDPARNHHLWPGLAIATTSPMTTTAGGRTPDSA